MIFVIYSQSEVTRLVAQLRFKAKPTKITKSLQGPRGGLEKIKKNVTALISHERIEVVEKSGLLARLYTEKLIGDALLYGDKHKHTMEMATWWLENVSF